MKLRAFDATCLDKIVVGFGRARGAVFGRSDLVEVQGKEKGGNWAIGSAILFVCVSVRD